MCIYLVVCVSQWRGGCSDELPIPLQGWGAARIPGWSSPLSPSFTGRHCPPPLPPSWITFLASHPPNYITAHVCWALDLSRWPSLLPVIPTLPPLQRIECRKEAWQTEKGRADVLPRVCPLQFRKVLEVTDMVLLKPVACGTWRGTEKLLKWFSLKASSLACVERTRATLNTGQWRWFLPDQVCEPTTFGVILFITSLESAWHCSRGWCECNPRLWENYILIKVREKITLKTISEN